MAGEKLFIGRVLRMIPDDEISGPLQRSDGGYPPLTTTSDDDYGPPESTQSPYGQEAPKEKFDFLKDLRRFLGR